MSGHALGFRRIAILLATIGAAASVAGCGRTLMFAESDGVNFAVRANAASNPPFEVNFGLNRTIATVVPPNKQNTDGQATGDAVNMFAGFQIDAGVEAQKVGAEVKIDTQFASGRAATAVASDPRIVAKITKIGTPTALTFGDDANSALLQGFLFKPGTTTIDPDHRQQILAAMKSAAGIEGVSATSFIFAKDYIAGRRLVVAALKLNE